MAALHRFLKLSNKRQNLKLLKMYNKKQQSQTPCRSRNQPKKSKKSQ
ncbi:hypothetical protein J4204_04205 [Candidatus Woesearchaeota archaeon]|nr:hypothetical protein [Candidatus Woesearchaeota archaeon]